MGLEAWSDVLDIRIALAARVAAIFVFWIIRATDENPVMLDDRGGLA